jgi:hypothetical protein
MSYCSTACQQRDAEQHNTLCSTFQDFQMYANNQPHNQSLQTMMGTLAARWRGGYMGHALKYTYADDDFEKADEGLPGDGFPLIALDLDTTSLGPLTAWPIWYTNRGGFGF